MKDFRKELQEIIFQIDTVKGRLADLSVEMDEADMETRSVDEALDALYDAIDILKDELEGEE